MSATTTVRRLLTCAGVAGLALTLTPAAGAGQAAAADKGLYGSQDPTYDGVFRQSLALVALDAAGRDPAPVAVGWLLDQQCADGGWAAYRADTSKPCDPKKEDTNATAMAVQALVALGGEGADKAVDAGMAWLRKTRNADGGIGYNPGGATDANSTGLLVNAVLATGGDPDSLRNGAGHTPVDALLGLRVGCAAPKDEYGAFAYQADPSGALAANDSATAAALLALAGGHLPVTKSTMRLTAPPPECPEGGSPAQASVPEAVGGAAAYLARRLHAHDGLLPPLQGDEPDYFTTANAALALVAAGQSGSAAAPTRALARDVEEYVPDQNGEDQPAALATLVLVAEAPGEHPADLRGEDLAARLAATGPPAPKVDESAGNAAGNSADTSDERQRAEEGASTLMSVGSILAAATAVAVGIGLYRRRGGR